MDDLTTTNEVHTPLRRKRDAERGQGLVEYGLILVLIAIVVIITLQLLGHTTNSLYSNISNGLAH